MNRFDRAISKLVKAFFEGDLEKGDCARCAVGNICDGRNEWGDVFYTALEGQIIDIDNYFGLSKYVIDKTGYSWQELAKIENSFELNTEIHHNKYRRFSKSAIMEDQYNGLMAVVDVLCEIEGIESGETKKLFEYQS